MERTGGTWRFSASQSGRRGLERPREGRGEEDRGARGERKAGKSGPTAAAAAAPARNCPSRPMFRTPARKATTAATAVRTSPVALASVFADRGLRPERAAKEGREGLGGGRAREEDEERGGRERAEEDGEREADLHAASPAMSRPSVARSVVEGRGGESTPL